MIDEELLRPSREHLAMLRAEIDRQQALAASDIERYGYGDQEYACQRWAEFYMMIQPMRREQEAVVKVMADYYGLHAAPPQILVPGQGPLAR
jgi:hypothetical protein